MSTPSTTIRLGRYKQCLTPALHKRFSRAAGFVLGLCYLEAVLISDKSSWLWSWFPLGFAGIRTLLLFLAALSVFVLRVAQLHLGSRATTSSFQSIRTQLFSFKVFQTFAWYAFSAWLFSEIYLWSAPKSANLGWISEGKPWERRRLNERPIYLRSVFMILTVVQTAVHLCLDYDRVSLPLGKRSVEEVANKQSPTGPQTLPAIVQPLDELRQRIPSLLRAICLQTVSIATLGPVVYALFIRRRAWDFSMFFARLFWDVAPTAELSYLPPYHISLMWRSFTSGFLLVLLWQSSNTIFSAFFTQEPLKRGQPLTAESSVPNQALIDGLRSAKEVNKSFAFWELLYISKYFDDRRKSIYTEISSPELTTWPRIMTESLKTVQALQTRIIEYQKPTSTPTQPTTNVESLPRLTSSLRQAQIFATPTQPSSRTQKVETTFGSFARSIGQSPPSRNKTPIAVIGYAGPYVKKLANAAGQKLLTQGQQTNLSPSGLRQTFNTYLTTFIASPLGYPFRRPFSRRINAIVFGTEAGYNDIFPILNAIEALSILAVASLKEDSYGKVAYDVNTIMTVYINTLDTLQQFVHALPTHWTDVEGRGEVEDVDLVCRALKEGLGRMGEAFEPYAVDFGIEGAVMRRARAATTDL